MRCSTGTGRSFRARRWATATPRRTRRTSTTSTRSTATWFPWTRCWGTSRRPRRLGSRDDRPRHRRGLAGRPPDRPRRSFRRVRAGVGPGGVGVTTRLARDRGRAARRRLGGLGAGTAGRRGREAGELPRGRRALASRLLPRGDRRDHGTGSACGAARLHARRRHLSPAVRARSGARPGAGGGSAGGGRRVRRGAGGEVRRLAGRLSRRVRAASDLRPAVAVLLHARRRERRGRRVPGLPAGAGRALASPDGAVPVRRRGSGPLLAPPPRDPEERPGRRPRNAPRTPP